jgi:hypothetical protein
LHFVDLVSYLLRMDAAKIGDSINKKYKLFADEDFNELTDPSFKLLLFTSHSTAAVPYLKMIRSLDKWMTTYKLSNFEHISRIGERQRAHWIEADFTAKIPRDVAKIYIAGSSSFISSVTATLLKSGYPRDLLVYL